MTRRIKLEDLIKSMKHKTILVPVQKDIDYSKLELDNERGITYNNKEYLKGSIILVEPEKYIGPGKIETYVKALEMARDYGAGLIVIAKPQTKILISTEGFLEKMAEDLSKERNNAMLKLELTPIHESLIYAEKHSESKYFRDDGTNTNNFDNRKSMYKAPELKNNRRMIRYR